jgi:hypothetical protein
MDEETKTGDTQAREPNMTPGKGGNIPPVSRRFGQPGGNPRNEIWAVGAAYEIWTTAEQALEACGY